ncbi:hypothetical protein ABBQ32_003537 [Trebouxia sp. C0010 RCD-2024]
MTEAQERGRKLIEASRQGDLTQVESCLLSGADATYQDTSDGSSPLMAAASQGHAEVVRRLLTAGAPWNAFDQQANCAGDYALAGQHQDCVDILLTAGVQAELILGTVERKARAAQPSNSTYLEQRVEYLKEGSQLVDEESQGVMMAWEGPLMQAHAKAICSKGGDVLNVGFGLGLVDNAIQSNHPASHTIIEAHPDVLHKMEEDGWEDRPNVRVVHGRWQDVLPQLGQYDGIFFDTFGEDYEDLRDFQNQLVKLLRPGGIYSYFNGLSADNAFFHMVACEVVRCELAARGLSTTFISLPINVSDPAIWQGILNKYWQLDTYLLPIVQWESADNEISTVE